MLPSIVGWRLIAGAALATALVALIGLLAVDYWRGDDASGDDASDAPASGGGVQELWILVRLDAVDLDGNLIDLERPLLESVAASAGAPVALSSKATFSVAPDFAVSMVDAEGAPIGSIDVVGGILESAGERAVAIVATPDEGVRTIGNGHTLRFALPAAPAIPHGTPLVTEHAYAQVHATEGEPSGDEGDNVELLAARMRDGTVATFVDDAGSSLIVTGEIGVARATAPGTNQSISYRLDPPSGFVTQTNQQSEDGDGSFADWLKNSKERAEEAKEAGETVQGYIDEAVPLAVGEKTAEEVAKEQAGGVFDDLKGKVKDKVVEAVLDEAADAAEIPADAQPLIDGIGEGLAGCGGLTVDCVKDTLDKIAEGFEESLEKTVGSLGEEDPDGEGGGGEGPDGGSGGGASGGGSSSGPGGSGSGGTEDSGGGSDSGGDGSDGTGDSSGGGGASGGGAGPLGDGSGPDGQCLAQDFLPGGSCNNDPKDPGDEGGKASTHNDPHVLTFDGAHYDLHVPGEFIAASAADGIEIQVRYEPVVCGCPVTVVGAVAIGDGEHRVFIDRDRGRLLAVDGEFLDLETQESVDAGALHVERSRGGVRVVDGDGNVVSVDIFAGSHLNVIVTPSDEGPWRGLMGNRNGDPNDEFQTREGEDLGSRPDYQTIAGVFADSWRITSQESLFEYDPGETTETFANARFPVAYPDEPLREVLTAQVNRSAQAEAVCRLAGITDPDLLAECAFDFQVSGNVSFVRASARVERSVSLDLTASTVPTPPTAPTVQADPASDERFTVGPARLTEISGADLATGAGLVLVRAADEDNRIILRAFDIETRALRWSAADVDASCGPVVMEGLGVAALVAHGSERLGADRSALVLLSLEDGSELARFVGDGEDVLVGCPATLNASGDVVIHIANSQARGFRIGDDITLLWRHEFEGPVGGHSPAVDGHFVVNSFLPGEGDGVAVTSLDAETGEVSSAIALPGRLTRSSPAAIEPVGDGRLAISTNGNLNVDPALALVDASSGGLDVIWVQTFRQGFGAVPQAMRLDDQVVGWSDRGEGLRLAGFSLATGEWIWSHIPEGSGTPGDVAVVGDDTVVISAHAVAWLEYVDGETRRWRVVDHPEHPERYSQPQQITVVADRTIVVTGATHDGGFYVEFVDVGTVR